MDTLMEILLKISCIVVVAITLTVAHFIGPSLALVGLFPIVYICMAVITGA